MVLKMQWWRLDFFAISYRSNDAVGVSFLLIEWSTPLALNWNYLQDWSIQSAAAAWIQSHFWKWSKCLLFCRGTFYIRGQCHQQAEWHRPSQSPLLHHHCCQRVHSICSFYSILFSAAIVELAFHHCAVPLLLLLLLLLPQVHLQWHRL